MSKNEQRCRSVLARLGFGAQHQFSREDCERLDWPADMAGRDFDEVIQNATEETLGTTFDGLLSIYFHDTAQRLAAEPESKKVMVGYDAESIVKEAELRIVRRLSGARMVEAMNLSPLIQGQVEELLTYLTYIDHWSTLAELRRASGDRCVTMEQLRNYVKDRYPNDLPAFDYEGGKLPEPTNGERQ